MVMNSNDKKIEVESVPQIDAVSEWLESNGVTLVDYMDAVRQTAC